MTPNPSDTRYVTNEITREEQARQQAEHIHGQMTDADGMPLSRTRQKAIRRKQKRSVRGAYFLR